MPIIVIGSSKGGSGKSTLCTNLIAKHAVQGNSCLLLDTDPQRSAANWASLRAERNVEPALFAVEKRERSGMDVTRSAHEMAKNYDAVFVDAPGNNSPELRASLVAADLLIYPIRPSNFDVWVFHEDMTNLLPQVRQVNPDLKMMVVMNGMSPSPSKRRKQISDLTSFLASYEGFYISPYVVCFRESFANASEEGRGVFELPAKGSSHERAIFELDDVYRDALSCIAGKHTTATFAASTV